MFAMAKVAAVVKAVALAVAMVTETAMANKSANANATAVAKVAAKEPPPNKPLRIRNTESTCSPLFRHGLSAVPEFFNLQ